MITLTETSFRGVAPVAVAINDHFANSLAIVADNDLVARGQADTLQGRGIVIGKAAIGHKTGDRAFIIIYTADARIIRRSGIEVVIVFVVLTDLAHSQASA